MKNWSKEIDSTTAEFEAKFGQLDNDQLNWKPNQQTWSIAQNIDHLIVINETYFPLLAQLRSGEYKKSFMSKFGFLVNFLGNAILKSVNPDRGKKVKTFPIWEPNSGTISTDIVSRFISHQSKLKEEIESCKDLILTNAVITSPANNNIFYKLETAFDIIVTHEKRHLQQAKEILSLVRKEYQLSE